MDEKTKQLLADIHNGIVTMHFTGDDILKAAAMITAIRNALAEANAEEGKDEAEK